MIDFILENSGDVRDEENEKNLLETLDERVSSEETEVNVEETDVFAELIGVYS